MTEEISFPKKLTLAETKRRIKACRMAFSDDVPTDVIENVKIVSMSYRQLESPDHIRLIVFYNMNTELEQ